MMKIDKLTTAQLLVGALLSILFLAVPDVSAETLEERRARVIEYWTDEKVDALANALDPLPILGEQGEVYNSQTVGSLYRLVLVARAPVPVSGARRLDAQGDDDDGASTTTKRQLQDAVVALEPANGSSFTDPRTIKFSASVGQSLPFDNLTFVFVDGSTLEETVVPVIPETEIEGTPPVATELVGGFKNGDWAWFVRGTNAEGAELFRSPEFTFNINGSSGERKLQTSTISNAAWTFGGQVKDVTGRLFFVMGGVGYICSGVAVKDFKTGRSLILTAAHCAHDYTKGGWSSNILFIPDRDGTTTTSASRPSNNVCNQDPCGCWVASGSVVLQEYFDETFPRNLKNDYALYIVDDFGAHTGNQCNPASTAIDETYDVMKFLVGPDAPILNQQIYAFGYPAVTGNDLRYCTQESSIYDLTQAYNFKAWWLGSCNLKGGASGGPWVQQLDWATGNGGQVVSITSFGFANRLGVGAPMINSTRAECMINYARNLDIDSLEFSQAKGVTVGTTCTPRSDDAKLTEAFVEQFVASTSGDPHFKTWTGEKFDYHGECDLVLIENPRFNNGQGLRLHIRTTRVGYYSYIERVALQIGDDVLEFANDVEKSLINGEKLPDQRKKHRDYFAGFYLRRDKRALSLRFDTKKKGGAKIDFLYRKNGFPAVIVDTGSTNIFDGSMGLLGEYGTGFKLARDGITIFGAEKDDLTAFALEWQVRDTEPMLFSDERYPQFPTPCIPPQKMMISRLGMARARAAAEKACAHWKEDKEDCIFDAIATRDMAVAAEGSIMTTSSAVG